MSETLWKRLCTADVPAKYAAVANRARATLTAAWADLSPVDRAEVGRLLQLHADGADLLRRGVLADGGGGGVGGGGGERVGDQRAAGAGGAGDSASN